MAGFLSNTSWDSSLHGILGFSFSRFSPTVKGLPYRVVSRNPTSSALTTLEDNNNNIDDEKGSHHNTCVYKVEESLRVTTA